MNFSMACFSEFKMAEMCENCLHKIAVCDPFGGLPVFSSSFMESYESTGAQPRNR